MLHIWFVMNEQLSRLIHTIKNLLFADWDEFQHDSVKIVLSWWFCHVRLDYNYRTKKDAENACPACPVHFHQMCKETFFASSSTLININGFQNRVYSKITSGKLRILKTCLYVWWKNPSVSIGEVWFSFRRFYPFSSLNDFKENGK